MWTVRIKRTGSKVLVEDYKKEILIKLLDTDEPIGSGKMYNHLVDIMNGDNPSRASVIFFLNALVENKYISFNDATGKGGHHKLYYSELTKDEWKNVIWTDINAPLQNALDEIFN